VDGYAICTIEAFAESITHWQNIDDRRGVVNRYIATQGDGKAVTKHIKEMSKHKGEKEVDDTASREAFLVAQASGFGGSN
jgi:hypothetical protein